MYFFRISKLCKQYGTNITTVESACGFSQNSIKKWEKASPTAARVVLVARHFNVSADYLLCLTDEPKPLENREIVERQTSIFIPIKTTVPIAYPITL